MTKKRLPAKLRRLVRQRAQGYCEYCICPEFCATQLHSIEHIDPESEGGPSDEDNLALACQGCNGSKSNHLYLIGLTPTGRATIRELDLNREGVIHLRRLLLLNNEHPPPHRSSR